MMTKIDGLAYEIDGDQIMLEQDAGLGEVDRIALHPIHLRHLAESRGLVSTVTASPPTSADLHSPTVDLICAAAGISRRMFFLAKKVHAAACDELLTALRDGTVSMNLAAELAKFDHDSQRRIMAEFVDLPRNEHLSFVQRVAAMHAADLGRACATSAPWQADGQDTSDQRERTAP